MTDRSGDGSADEISGAPIDFDRLDTIEARLATAKRFSRIDSSPEFAPERIVCIFDSQLYPPTVTEARLEIAWFENGDFSLHYHENQTYCFNSLEFRSVSLN